MRSGKNFIIIVSVLVLACSTAAWESFRTKNYVRKSSALRESMIRMWHKGGWSQSPIRQEIQTLILADLAVGDDRRTVEEHIKRHFKSWSFKDNYPMLPPYDPYYSILAVRNQDAVCLSEIRIQYWFRTNTLIKIEVVPSSTAL